MIILHIKNPKEFTNKLLKVISKVSKITGLKVSVQKYTQFYILAKKLKSRILNQYHLQ